MNELHVFQPHRRERRSAPLTYPDSRYSVYHAHIYAIAARKHLHVYAIMDNFVTVSHFYTFMAIETPIYYATLTDNIRANHL